MDVRLTRTYEVEAAHQLTAGVGPSHKCRRLHGHRYEIQIEISGEPASDGMLIEYATLDRIVMPILRKIDHHSLNDLDQRCSTPEAAAVADNPTVELLVQWLWVRLGLLASARPKCGIRLRRVRVQEDSRSWCEVVA